MTYREYFKNKLKQRGVASPMQLDKDQRKKFFDDIKSGWAKQKGTVNVAENYLKHLFIN